ncbi:MAG: pectinesterase family protein [Paludibacter sp.]|nr:pectinesterase family protein [Paludibacter sp.]
MKKHFYFLSIFMMVLFTNAFATTSKIEIWDFGAAELNTDIYNNNLTVDVINAWWPDVTAGTTGKNIPMTWTAGDLTWTSTSATSDRLRTSNTELTRYDSNGSPITIGTETLTGALYVNATASTTRYLTLSAAEDDEITIYCKSQNASGSINFVNTTTSDQSDILNSNSSGAILKFYAKNAGDFKIYDSQDKPYYYRIVKAHATYQTFTGTADITEAADIPEGYKIVFTNSNGKAWTCPTTGNSYSASLPVGFTYTVSLQDANGYIITSEKSVEVTSSTSTFNLTLKKVDLYTVSGNITGLGTDISNMELVFTPSVSSTYIPVPNVDTNAGTYSVELENGYTYTLSANGINDYYLADNTISIEGSAVAKDLAFSTKPTYAVTIFTSGLTTEQAANLQLTFTNMNESGYSYSFSSTNDVALRTGVYSVTASGLDEYPYQLALTSNLKVEDAPASKTLSFERVYDWSFDDEVINSSTTNYKGIQFTGNIANEISKGHLTAKAAATIAVPVSAGEKVIVSYYYSADFSIEGGTAITTNSGSTNTIESTEYTYTGSDDGYVTLTVGSSVGTTYLTDIKTVPVIVYESTIYVGPDKTYQTINDALTAISHMVRGENDRVTIMIDPGNYEEMLVINQANVTLKNASITPTIALSNAGVDIDANAVRITSYYGHGYSYYSMGTDQKWHADILAVNKENGYLSYTNTGSGTTNGSYWNATVVVSANGFEADNIIFENSYNQYISLKESQDIVEEWSVGGKGTRPTNYGNTSVQDKSFVERAAALAITNNVDKVVLNKCRVIGRQDSFYGGTGSRVVMYKGSAMGSTDYIFGGMTAVFYKTDLAMNTSEASTDVSYITAAQQSSGRGYLMYNCNITSAEPATETASQYLSKPGYFGRPWLSNTSEVVFYNTNIGKTNNPDFTDHSFIMPVGWNNSLGGESAQMYEYGSVESSGTDNSSSRASWATLLSTPTLMDETDITTFNFTKGSDNWDPIPTLIAADPTTGVISHNVPSTLTLSVQKNSVSVTDVTLPTTIHVYGIDGTLQKSFNINSDTKFSLNSGLWIIELLNSKEKSISKTLIK